MPPYTLQNIRNRHNGTAIFDPDAINLRPLHGALAMQVIATWGENDQIFALLVSEFLKADFEIVSAMLQALTGGESRRAAIDAAARAALNKNDLNLFLAVIQVTRASRNRRNEFAHHQWGYLTENEDALLLADPRYFMKFHADQRAFKAGYRRSGSVIDARKILVFTKRALEEEVEAATNANGLISFLRVSLSNDSTSAQARSELLAHSQVRQALERMSTENNQ